MRETDQSDARICKVDYRLTTIGVVKYIIKVKSLIQPTLQIQSWHNDFSRPIPDVFGMSMLFTSPDLAIL